MLDESRMNRFKEYDGAAALKWRDELVAALQSRISDNPGPFLWCSAWRRIEFYS